MSTPTTTGIKVSKISLICAFFVVCIHCKPEGALGGFTWWVTELFNKGICSIAVPFFFTVSGSFLAKHVYEEHWWKREVSKRFRTLLIPYVSWSVLYFLYAISLILIANILANTSLLRNIPGILSILGLDPLDYPYLIPLWFVRCLFIFVLVSPLIVWIIKKNQRVSSIFLLLIFPLGLLRTFLQPEEGEVLWFTVGTFSLLNLFYFSLGFHLALYPPQQLKRKFPTYLAGCAWIIFLTLQALAALYLPNFKGCFNFLSIPAGLYFVWQATSVNPWSRTLTQASFPIFVLHMFFLSIIGLALKNLVPVVAGTLITCFASSIVAFFASILVSYFAHKYFPRMAHFLFGGR